MDAVVVEASSAWRGPIPCPLPDRQRRSPADLQQDLDLSSGDSRAKQSAFWTMFTSSSVIAACGILTVSTATVIGAMIIAPLSTPTVGTALGAVQRRRTTAARFVFLGCLLVVLLGALASLVVPRTYDLLSNGQVSGRTSPGLPDLIAALATGFAGAVALARSWSPASARAKGHGGSHWARWCSSFRTSSPWSSRA